MSEMETVMARFAQRLPERVSSIQALLREHEQCPKSACRSGQSLARARREAHQLAGTAGTYGLDRVSRAARRLEHALDAEDASTPGVREALADLTAAVRAPQQTTPEPGEREDDETLRILLVDPDPRYHRLADAGGRARAQITATGELEKAIELAVTGRWDGLIADASLGPPDDPLEPVRRLRRDMRGGWVPLAVTSSDDSMDMRVAAVHAGADLFLCKPLSASSFEEAITTLAAHATAKRPSVLVVDDDEDFLAWMARLLGREGIDVTTLSDTRGILEALSAAEPDGLVLDFDMPGYNGAELAAMLRAAPEHSELPIVFVTSHRNPELRRRAYAAGADGFVTKPFDGAELCQQLRARIERSLIRRARAERDPLTGLPHRHVFVTAVETRLAEAARRDEPLTFCLLDLDRFKAINDAHGHAVGDRVLSEIGALLVTRFREEDLRCRWGGEEFALAFPGKRSDTIEAVMARVLDDVRALDITTDEGEPVSISFSAGLAERPADGVDLDRLARVADERLYRAKASGRGRIISE